MKKIEKRERKKDDEFFAMDRKNREMYEKDQERKKLEKNQKIKTS